MQVQDTTHVAKQNVLALFSLVTDGKEAELEKGLHYINYIIGICCLIRKPGSHTKLRSNIHKVHLDGFVLMA